MNLSVRLSQADCIQLGTQELEILKGMSGLQRLSLCGLTKLTDATLLQVHAPFKLFQLLSVVVFSLCQKMHECASIQLFLLVWRRADDSTAMRTAAGGRILSVFMDRGEFQDRIHEQSHPDKPAAAFPQALEACGWRLRHLDISDCAGLTDASLRAVGERCGVLESFSLGMCPLLTTDAVREVRP